MNFVEPIRDRKKIAQIKNLLRGEKQFRDLLLFIVGINTALRISYLLRLQIVHFLDDRGRIRQRFWRKEQKRGKRHEEVLNESIQEALKAYLTVNPGIVEKPWGEELYFDNTKVQASANINGMINRIEYKKKHFSCTIRNKSLTDSGACRTPILEHAAHCFRG